MTGVLGNTEIGLCRAMWLREERMYFSNAQKLKKQEKEKIKLFIREMGFKQMFTHVLCFSNHKHSPWVFVQENKQRTSRCPLSHPPNDQK